MIGQLRGELLVKQPPRLLLDVQGVGYELEAPMSTFYDLPEVGQRVVLITHLAVREDAHILYGFMRESDRALFRNLLRVTGVGARMALAILSGMDAEGFARCVQQQDVAALIRLPGIGKRTAERLIMEMRDRLDGFSMDPAQASPAPARAASPEESALSDAIGALIALGYKPVEANRMARAASAGATHSEEIIRAALRAASG